MEFRFDDGLPVLRRTPAVLHELLADLPGHWTNAVEGPGTWSPFDVVGHLIHGERTDWVPRIEHMLRHGDAVPFPPFDREAMFAASRGSSLGELLDTFGELRAENLNRLAAMGLTDRDLARRGRHPEFGIVTLRQHLATWVAHDLGHVGQIVRVMARQYSEAVGPWRAYLSILRPDGDAIADIEQQIAKAWVNHDRAAIEAILAPEWSVTDPAGEVLTRDQVLAQTFGSTERKILTMAIDHVRVRTFGDTAVATGRTHATGSYRGTSASVVLRFTDVFVRRGGRWQVVASHGTNVVE